MIPNSREDIELKKLIPTLGKAGNRQRYRHLLEADQTFETYPMSGATSRVDGKSSLAHLKKSVNFDLLRQLQALNAMRVAKVLFDQPAYQQNKSVIAAFLAGCAMGEGSPYHLAVQQTAQVLVKKDPRLKDFLATITLSQMKKIAQGGNLGWLWYFNSKKDLGLYLDLHELGMHTNDEIIEKLPASSKDTITPYFHTGFADYAPMILVRGLAALDPAFADLKKYACPDKNILRPDNGSCDTSPLEEQYKTRDAVCRDIVSQWH